jgi:hypothetical protein
MFSGQPISFLPRMVSHNCKSTEAAKLWAHWSQPFCCRPQGETLRVLGILSYLLQDNQARLKTPQASQLTLKSYFPYPTQTRQCSTITVDHGLKRVNGMCSGLWTWILLILEHTTSYDIVTWFSVPTVMLLPLSLQVSQLVTQWWDNNAQVRATLPMISNGCVASYQPPPSYFYSIGETKASMLTEHWCEITPNENYLGTGVYFTQTNARWYVMRRRGND